MYPEELVKARRQKIAELTRAENMRRNWERVCAELQQEIGRIEALLAAPAPRHSITHSSQTFTIQEEH